MATTERQGIDEAQLEVAVHWSGGAGPVVARLDQTQARELIGRLSLMAPDDGGVTTAMQGQDPSRLLLGLQAFCRVVLEREGCVALADVEGGIWTIPAGCVNGIRVRVGPSGQSAGVEPDPPSLQRAFATAVTGRV